MNTLKRFAYPEEMTEDAMYLWLVVFWLLIINILLAVS